MIEKIDNISLNGNCNSGIFMRIKKGNSPKGLNLFKFGDLSN